MIGYVAMGAIILIGITRAAALRIKRREAEDEAKASREP
jgi:hypothetical protein